MLRNASQTSILEQALLAEKANLVESRNKPGEFYHAGWLRFLDLRAKVLALYKEADKAERHDYQSLFDVIPDHYACITPDPPSEFSDHRVEDFARKIVERLCSMAATLFSRPGLPPLDIDTYHFQSTYLSPLMPTTDQKSGEARFAAEQFDPRLVWSALRERYEESGKELVLFAMAKKLKDVFGLSAGKQVTWRSGKLVLSIHTQIDSHYPDIYSYHAQGSIREACAALAAFATWAEFGTTASALTRRGWEINKIDYRVRSREVYTMPHGFSLITFKNKVEFVLDRQAAEVLQGFISEYGGA